MTVFVIGDADPARDCGGRLLERGDDGNRGQRDNSYDRAEMPRDAKLSEFARGAIQMPGVTQLLPMAADDIRRLTGIRRDEVAGSHRAGQVAGFGQISAVLTHRAEHRVPAGRWRRPRADGAVSGFEGQGVFGVDAADFGPRNFHAADHIAHVNTGGGDNHRWAPKHGPGQQRYQTEDGGNLQGLQPAALNGSDDQRGGAGGNDNDSKYAPESRVQGEVWRHGTMFPRAHHFQGERRDS